MRFQAAVIDTNVVVSGVLSGDPASPTAWLLAGMLKGVFPYLLSTPLLAEYRQVLLRPKIRGSHGLSDKEVDVILTGIVVNGIIREPEIRMKAPDPGNNNLWSLLESQDGAVLVTGDRALIKNSPAHLSVILPSEFVAVLQE